ncbi:type II toxin-antitoxin system RelE/ParE family toxin [Rhizobium sp. SL86]|uniref:type II toxin-antitoxin system RelE/ParE family toxin n=1 Tax=Rhizobium sp. SL86 TaxID=2995148 RepID=UPI002275B0B9|nr:type II toxin-antitoxin system RelE/ParE family toxin [Rhizobium sp. SL86]MCY1669293.1 type II toxin-antitoxin system RelE/ParE family toxin [Rhizobium sp. SL86]
MIRSFKDARTRSVAGGHTPKGFPSSILKVAIRKLTMINVATTLDDLRSPPGNRLEALKGDRSGQHSIRINDQWRICFVWREGGAEDLEIVDYH